MADPDIFFRLTPDKRNLQAQRVIRLAHNQLWQALGAETTNEDDTSDSRYSTPAPVAVDRIEDIDEDALIIRFSTLFSARNRGSLPPLNQGMLFGTDRKSCHIHLVRSTGISAKHCGLFIDQQLRVYLCDVSRYGTAVECNSQNANHIRKNSRWVLTRRAKEQRLFGDIVINVNQLRIRIDFPNHDSTFSEYEQNLQAFLALLEEDADSLGALRIDSVASTLAPSSTATPGATDIYYQLHRLGKGGFASVYQAVEAQSGSVFAMKVFPRAADKRRRGSHQPKWLENIQREFTLMRDHRHANVVEVVALLEREHSIAIVMEYYPDGNIEDVQLDEPSYVSAAGQLLDGLQHLHSHGLTHRDMKPANILVRLLHFKVVMADFGLSKIAAKPDSLKTFCGSLKYAAPEVLQRRGYGTKVDVWSWGVMVFHWMYPGPPIPRTPNERDTPSWSKEWLSRLRSALDDQDECKFVTLLSLTIAESPEQRWAAQECLDFGFNDPPLFKRRQCDNVVICIDADEHSSVLWDEGTTGKKTLLMIEAPAEGPSPHRQAPEASKTRSHLSTRSIVHERDFVCLVIQRRRVSMRKSNHDLNAVEILQSAGLTQARRRHYLEIFKERRVGARDGKAYWIPFADGVYLCRAIGVFDTLRALLLWPDEDLNLLKDNYLLQKKRSLTTLPQGFASLADGDHEIVYKPRERLINARHLVNMSGHRPSTLRLFLTCHEQCAAQCVKFVGHQRIQGTYLPYEQGHRLCEYLELSSQPLLDLLRPAPGTVAAVTGDDEIEGPINGGLPELCFSEGFGTSDDGAGGGGSLG